MTSPSEQLFLLSSDVALIRRAVTPRLEPKVSTYVDRFGRNGIEMLRANGRGIPVSKQKPSPQAGSGGYWAIPKALTLPAGLTLHPDPRQPGRFLLCPDRDMMMAKYSSLVAELALLSEYHKES